MIEAPLSRRGVLRCAALLGAGAALPFPGLAASQADWPRVRALVERYVGEKRLAGAVATLGFGEGPLQAIVRGTEGFTDGDAVTADSLFRVYSMTKPVTGMAAMLLIEEGRLGLDQELADIFPEFGDMQVAIDPAKSLDARPAKTRITIRHMLTHTAGFGYAGIARDAVSMALLNEGVTPAVVSRLPIPGITPPVPTLPAGDFLRRAAQTPLVAEPGTRWAYSMSLDLLGLVIQKVSGASSFEAFLAERLFGPAGMSSSFFRVPPARTGRLTTNYAVLGSLPLALDPAETTIYLDEPSFAFGGAGLVTTPADYDRFLTLLVSAGRIDGRQVIPASAVALGMSNLLPEDIDTRGTFIAGAGFGAGGRVGLGADAGSFGWSGAAGTVGFVNARIGLRAGLYVQFMPPGSLPIQQEFIEAARGDVLERGDP